MVNKKLEEEREVYKMMSKIASIDRLKRAAKLTVLTVLISSGLYFLASSPGGYSIRITDGIPEILCGRLCLNPILHPLSYLNGEGTIMFTQDLGSTLGPVEYTLHGFKFSVKNTDIVAFMLDFVKRSANFNLLWHYILGFFSSLGLERIYRAIAKRKTVSFILLASVTAFPTFILISFFVDILKLYIQISGK